MKNSIKSILVLIAFLGLAVSSAYAKVPWGTIYNVTGQTPVATFTATGSSVILYDITGNVTSLTLTGGSVGSFQTLILMQDGTGSRTFTAPTNITAGAALGGALPAIPSAANAYTVWVLQTTAANTYQLVSAFDNLPLLGSFVTTQSSNGTAVSSGVTQSQGSVVLPGATVASVCICQPQTTPATWQTGIALGCLPATNYITCQETNPTAATITPATVTLNVQLVSP